MELKRLGQTEAEVPEIGLGTWNYKGDKEPLRIGISLGAYLLDTAETYSTEPVVGEAAKGQRDQVFIVTKVSGDHLRHDQVLRSCDDSLKRLQTDYIDLYLVHWPDSQVPIAETIGVMERLVDEGKVRFIGVSNFSLRLLREAQKVLRKHPIVANQLKYHLSQRGTDSPDPEEDLPSFLRELIEGDMLPYCEENNITVMAYSPFDQGRLLAKPGVLQDIAEQIGKSAAQVAINWCTRSPAVIAIPKSDSVRRIRDNCAASGWRLSREHIDALDRAFG